jgi:sulfoxide reductase heme-binding subunit YedZ
MLAAMSTTTSTTLWYTMRATGVVALVLLSGTMVLGILTAGRTSSRAWPAFARADLHKRVSLLAMVFLAFHVLTAVLDTYVSVGWASVVVPFASPYRPLWTGLGTMGVDLIGAVAVTSALRQRISARTWRGVHWLAYGSWPVAMAHSLGMGTDASTLWMDGLAAVCTVAVVGALAWRVTDHRQSRALALQVGAVTRAVPLGPPPRQSPPVTASSTGSGAVPRSSRPYPVAGSTSRSPDAAVRLLEKDRP